MRFPGFLAVYSGGASGPQENGGIDKDAEADGPNGRDGRNGRNGPDRARANGDKIALAIVVVVEIDRIELRRYKHADRIVQVCLVRLRVMVLG